MNAAMKADEIYVEDRNGPDEQGLRAGQTAALFSLPIAIAVSIGRTTTTVEQLLTLTPNTILPLDTSIDDPVELLVGGCVIARGSLVELADGSGIGVEITELIDGGLRT